MAKSKGCMIALAVMGVVALAGIAGVVYFFNKASSVVQDIATGVGVSPEVQKEVKSLNREYEFERPSDNRISERQIQRLIAIKKDFATKVQGYEERFKELDKRSQGDPGWKEFSETYKALGDIRRDFLKSLREHKMSPKEYAFLTEQVYQTYFTVAAKQGAEQMKTGVAQMQEMYKTQMAQMQERLDNEELTDEQRDAMEAAMQSYKDALAQVDTNTEKLDEDYEELPEENIALLEKYRPQLEELNTLGFEFWGLTLTEVN